MVLGQYVVCRVDIIVVRTGGRRRVVVTEFVDASAHPVIWSTRGRDAVQPKANPLGDRCVAAGFLGGLWRLVVVEQPGVKAQRGPTSVGDLSRIAEVVHLLLRGRIPGSRRQATELGIHN